VSKCGTCGTLPHKIGCQGAAPVPFDLETGSLADLHRAAPGYAYVRLCGTPDGITTDPQPVLDAIAAGRPVAAHNGFGFDFLALARHHGLDLLAASEAGLLVDSKVLAFLADPPEARQQGIERYYGLNATAQRLGFEGKTDDIKRLAKQHGGFHLIPQDDPAYRSYLDGDVAAMLPILDAYPMTEYAQREHRILGRLVTGISLAGWRVDESLLAERVGDGERLVVEKTAWLRDTYGLPTTRKDGTPTASPHKTAAGRDAIAAAFLALGIDLPRTDSGNPALGKDVLGPFRDELEADGGHPDLLALVDTVLALNGVRTVYGSVLDWTVDGRTHSTIDARQSSGRLSVVDPGLTVMGKRGGKWREREVFLPDEGDVLVAFDLDQIDARAIAAHAQDDAYLAMFEPGMDVHTEVALRVFGDAAERERAKAIGHGWNYGMSIDGLVRNGVEREAAERFDAGMREQFPRLVAWKDEVREEARAGGLLDNGFGRLMRPTPGREHTQAPALIGQGCARDLMMEGVLRLPLEVVPRLRAVVHDELVFSLPAKGGTAMADAIVEALTFEWRGVKITAGRSRPGATWGDCYRKDS
jgi:DNA polymerase-1